MVHRCVETPLFAVDVADGLVITTFARSAPERREWMRHAQALKQTLCALARTDSRLAGALIVDVGRVEVSAEPGLKSSFAGALQTWEAVGRPVAIVDEAGCPHVERIGQALAPTQGRVVRSFDDARAWVSLAGSGLTSDRTRAWL